MAIRQRGIPRPRRTAVDLQLREAILDVLTKLQGTGTLSALAAELQISVKTLSRYRKPIGGKPATLGGDVLFRICGLCDEREISIPCHGRILRLPKSSSRVEAQSAPEQLRLKFTGTVEIDVPARKGAITINSIVMDDQKKTG